MKKNIDLNILFSISLLVSLIGIMGLFLLSGIEPKARGIENISRGDLDIRVKIIGEIDKVSNITKTFFILKLEDDTGEIDVLLEKWFDSDEEVEVVGKVEEYKGNLQIRAERIKEIEDEDGGGE